MALALEGLIAKQEAEFETGAIVGIATIVFWEIIASSCYSNRL